jgi:hypothetical protein
MPAMHANLHAFLLTIFGVPFALPGEVLGAVADGVAV